MPSRDYSTHAQGYSFYGSVWTRLIKASLPNITLAFSCGARSAFNREVRNYLRNMLSRRQLQGLVRCGVEYRLFDTEWNQRLSQNE
jgi:hypothetical protein